MGRTPRCTLATLVVASLLVACGDDAVPGAGSDAAGARADATGGGAASGAAADAPQARAERPVVVSREAVGAYLAEWSAAKTDEERERLVAEFAAAGPPAIDALVAALRGDPPCEIDGAFQEAVSRLGPAAHAALAHALATLGEQVRDGVLSLLEEQRDAWRFAPEGSDVCRGVLAAWDADPKSCGDSVGSICGARPAGAAIAAELARRFAEPHSTDVDLGDPLLDALTRLGTDAAPAARTMLALFMDGRAPAVLDALRSIGPADPSILPDLTKLLAGEDRDLAVDVCKVLAVWGDAADAAGPDLVALLADARTRDDAAAALRSMPTFASAHLLDVLTKLGKCDEDATWAADDLLTDAIRDPAQVRRLVAALPSLPPYAASHVFYRLGDVEGGVQVEAARLLVKSPDAELRAYAAEILTDAGEGTADPRVVALLDDPDAEVRATALRSLAQAGALAADRVRPLALALRGERESRVRALAIDALTQVRAVTDADTAWLVAAARDADLRDAALEALATLDRPMPRELADLVPSLVAEVLASGYGRTRRIELLDRLPGGIDTLLAAVTAAWDARPRGSSEWVDAFAAAAALGPRAAPVRARIARECEAAADAWYRSWLQAALAAIDGDADALMRSRLPLSVWNVDEIAALGEPGFAALVRAAGHDPESAESVLARTVGDDTLHRLVREFAAPGRTAEERTGAARLSSCLPSDFRTDVRAALLHDPGDEVRLALAVCLLAEARADASTVPVELLRTALSDASAAVRANAAAAAARLGPRGTALVERLRSIAGTSSDVGLVAALAVARLTRDASASLAALRAILAADEDLDLPDWTLVGDAFAEAPLPDADLVALLAMPASAFRNDPAGRTIAILRGVARSGPAAATAVPRIREILALLELSPSDRDRSETPPTHVVETLQLADEAARALVAIGPAARAAIPDLHIAAARLGDPTGALRDAIAKLSAMPEPRK